MNLNLFAFQTDNTVILENYIQTTLDNKHPFIDSKCGTRYELAIEAQKSKIDPALYEKYRQVISAEPIRQRSMVTEAGLFELHWDESGINAVPEEDLSGNGYPDFIDSASVILDYVYKIEVEQLGYDPPPGQDGNPAVPYQIFFTNQFAYGITRKGDLIAANLPDTSYTSYIEMDNNFAEYYFPSQGLDGLKVTAAHEFHHAIQLGYGFRESDIYFFEMTSTWLEEYIYPEIDDYLNYLDFFFEVVSNSRFDQNNLTYPYANSIYLQMLEAQYDASIIRSIWDKLRTEKSHSAIKSTLEQNNTTWYQSLNHYALWLFYTGDRAISGTFFKDAAFFPEITIKSEDKIEFDAAFVEDVNITEIANRYIEIQNVRGKILDIQVIADNGFKSGYRTMTEYSYSQSYDVNTGITSEPIDSDQLVLVMTNSGRNELVTTVDISLSGSIDLTSIYPFPNPVHANSEKIIRFQNVPPEAELHIFNTSGKRIARIKNQGSSRIRSWYLKNDDGKEVAAGIYFYLVQGDGILEKGKFSLIR
jgi:hypothetical protein